MSAAKQYYVHHLSTPPDIHGPYYLKTAKQYARIGAKPGYDDRKITRGRRGVKIRVYSSEERIYPVKVSQLRFLTPAEIPPSMKKAARAAERAKTKAKTMAKAKTKKTTANPKKKTATRKAKEPTTGNLRVEFWKHGRGFIVEPKSAKYRTKYLKILAKTYGEKIMNEPVVYLDKKDDIDTVCKQAKLTAPEKGLAESGQTVTKVVSIEQFNRWVRKYNNIRF
jgi:hypothetical protein